MDLNNYNCPVCGTPVASWLVRRSRFTCSGCNASFRSNHGPALRRSLWLALSLWLLIGFGWWFLDTWQRALVVGLELGAGLAFVGAMLYYRHSLRIEALHEEPQ
jgi:uncharacterized paraquat-inducible protein A